MMEIEEYKKTLESMSKEELLNEISNLISDSGIQLQNKDIELKELKSALARADLQLQFQIGEVDIKNIEIERLTEDYEERLCTAANVYQVALDEKAELQKQVDELTDFKNQVTLFGLYGAGLENGRKQAVKDTAKEIYDKCIAIDKATGCKGFVCIEAIAELSKGKGVEVE